MSIQKTILIVEYLFEIQKSLTAVLSPEYTLLHAKNSLQALSLLNDRSKPISGILLALPLLNGESFSLLKTIRANPFYHSIPVLIYAQENERPLEIQALQLGAWDFMVKPCQSEVIMARLRTALAKSRVRDRLLAKVSAELDPLTGLYSKAKLFAEIRKMLDAFPEKEFALIRVDIDRFKLINSFFGAEEGDRLLLFLTDILRTPFHGIPYLYGRIEGDIFAACCSYSSRDELLDTLASVQEKIKSYNRSFDIVPIIGIYFIEDRSIPITEMMDRATLAAKPCKGNYLNTIGIYESQLSQKLQQEQEIINEMNAALQQKQFCVYLQAKYSLETSLPAGAEALVRWQHPTKGLLSPGAFIPVLEKNGFIARLDYYIWEEVCRLLQEWRAQGLHPAPISVNVSRVNLYNPRTVKILQELVARYQLPAKLLQLELTESAYMDNPKMMEQFVDQLHRLGFTVLMDDFGSGYSSLSVLKDINVDILKIDMRFFENTKIPGRGENIVASVVRMAKWLNMPTVAEGVEKEEQVDFLRSVGCDFVQGYYFTRPVPAQSYKYLMKSKVSTPVHPLSTASVPFEIDRLWSCAPEIDMLFSNATQAICIYEFDSQHVEVLRVNKVFNELFGYNQEIKCINPLDFIVTEDHAMILDALQNCVESKGNEVCLYRRKEKDQKIRWVELTLQYVCPVGKKNIIMGHLTDITAQKSMEFELEKFKQAASFKTSAAKKLLIIEGFENKVQALQKILEKEFQILTAADGPEALQKLLLYSKEIDAVIAEHNLPRMDIFEFLRQKNKDPETAGIPVLMVATEGASNQAELRQLGVHNYLSTPFVPEVVIHQIKDVLEYSGRFGTLAREYQKAVEGFPDGNQFEIDQIYSIPALRLLLRFLAPIFDVVRLVDPADTALIHLTEDGQLIREPYSCFKIWGKNSRCENCSSMCTLYSECRMTKYEFIKNNIFYVVSNPLTIRDAEGKHRRTVLEIVSRVSDHIMLRKHGEKTLLQLIDETQKKIYTDELTGAYNRRYFREMLFAHHGQTGLIKQMALVMLDLHGFKQVNDRHGHAIGDDVLVRVAATLMKIVRQSDSVIRYGGDEFVVILANCDKGTVETTVSRMSSALNELRYGADNSLIVTADFGFSYTENFDLKKETVKSMLDAADQAMYLKKKESTRNENPNPGPAPAL